MRRARLSVIPNPPHPMQREQHRTHARLNVIPNPAAMPSMNAAAAPWMSSRTRRILAGEGSAFLSSHNATSTLEGGASACPQRFYPCARPTCVRSRRKSQSSAKRYPGVFPNRPPKACASSMAISQVIHEVGASCMVTSSNAANTGSMSGSDIAAELK
jgi:hypothetical protein